MSDQIIRVVLNCKYVKKKQSWRGGDIITCKSTYMFILAVSMLITGLPFAAAVENQNGANNGFNQNINKNVISNDANADHNLKTAKVNAKTVTKKVKHGYSKKSLSSYRIGKGTGDCWQNSEILYNQLKSSGQSVRIIQYRTSLSPRHRSVQICQNGAWVDYNYKANGYAKLYYACKNKPGACVIK